MKQRIITAVIALILFIPIVFAGGPWIGWLAVFLAGVAIGEIFLMKKQILVSIDFVLTLLATLTWVVPDNFFKSLPGNWTKFGVFFALIMLLLTWGVFSKNRTTFDDIGVYTLSALYIGTGFHYLAGIRWANNGLVLLGFIFVVVWLTDTGAYVIGRQIGKHKLWPVISPNKTWEGSIGGTVVAVICAAVYVYFSNLGHSPLKMCGIAFLLSIVGQIGDLVESAYKRFYNVKDSGKILPGHGGILDRFDSMLFVLPVAAALLGIVH